MFSRTWGRNGGGIQWTFSEGVLQLLTNLHFTGGRTFKMNYTLSDGTQGTININKISKGTYCNRKVLEQAGLAEKGTDIRTLSLLNNNSSGEVRIYDMYIRVPDDGSATGINTLSPTIDTRPTKFLQNGRLVIMRNGTYYDALGRRLMGH